MPDRPARPDIDRSALAAQPALTIREWSVSMLAPDGRFVRQTLKLAALTAPEAMQLLEQSLYAPEPSYVGATAPVRIEARPTFEDPEPSGPDASAERLLTLHARPEWAAEAHGDAIRAKDKADRLAAEASALKARAAYLTDMALSDPPVPMETGPPPGWMDRPIPPAQAPPEPAPEPAPERHRPWNGSYPVLAEEPPAKESPL